MEEVGGSFLLHMGYLAMASQQIRMSITKRLEVLKSTQLILAFLGHHLLVLSLFKRVIHLWRSLPRDLILLLIQVPITNASFCSSHASKYYRK